MKKLILATTNKGKLREFKEMTKEFDVEILSLADFPEIGEIVEDGDSFAENAMIKAKTVGEKTKTITFADDSGLEVDALGKRPGIYSARYAGEDASDEDNNQKLLRELEGVLKEKRTARYVCAVAVYNPVTKEELVFEDTCEGIILDKYQGDGGFGYDPMFFLPELGKTFAEISMDEKNKISHRGKAFKKVASRLKEILK